MKGQKLIAPDEKLYQCCDVVKAKRKKEKGHE